MLNIESLSDFMGTASRKKSDKGDKCILPSRELSFASRCGCVTVCCASAYFFKFLTAALTCAALRRAEELFSTLFDRERSLRIIPSPSFVLIPPPNHHGL